VDVIRRGYLGLILFIVALVLMPLLVIDYHRQSQGDHPTTALVNIRIGASQAAATASAASTPTIPSDLPMIAYFQGVEEGETLHGNVKITLVTTGDVGAVSYTLTGYSGNWLATTAPYLFAPQPVGWATADVKNGQYTLTAAPDNPKISPRSVSFEVQN
jgi:hypothetical protein